MRGRFVSLDGDTTVRRLLVLEILQTINGPVASLLRIAPLPSEILHEVQVNRLRLLEAIPRNASDVISLLVARAFDKRGTDSFQYAFSCRTEFKPFQFRPLLKYYGAACKRLLVADETGLGKTVEAGYIIAEEVAGAGASRVIILCPSHLKRKWRYELWSKFGLLFRETSARGLVESFASDSKSFCLICSIDAARFADFNRLEQVLHSGGLDLLIVDEVHNMIGRVGETMRRRLALALASISRGIVCLSATPVHIDVNDLRKVLDIASPGTFDEVSYASQLDVTALVNQTRSLLSSANWNDTSETEVQSAARKLLAEASGLTLEEYKRITEYASLIMSQQSLSNQEVRGRIRDKGVELTVLSRHINRTRAKEVGEDRKRVIKTVRVELNKSVTEAIQKGKHVSVSEHLLYQDLDQFFKFSFLHVHRQQLSSCLPAMVDLLRMGASGSRTWRARQNRSVDSLLRKEERLLSEEERMRCGEFVNLYNLKPLDSKWKALSSCIEKIRDTGHWRKAIVFTHWIPTYRYLADQCRSLAHLPVFLASPDSDNKEIEDLLVNFRRSDRFSILLTTDRLNEGVDLDAADCVINYDLPYNPQEVEQRVGRVDRVCQKSERILIVNILVADSLDEQIYDRVLNRTGIFRRAIGDMRPIVEEMANRLEDEGTIDDNEAIRISTILADRERLMEHDAFSAVEDVFDTEIRSVHQRSRYSILGVHWLVLKRFFENLCPTCHCTWIRDPGALIVEGFTEKGEEALGWLVGTEHAELLDWTLATARESDGTLRFMLTGGRDSLALTNPLMRTAMKLVAAQFSGMDADRLGRVPTLELERPVVGLSSTFDSIALFEYAYRGRQVFERKMVWLGIARDGQSALVPDLDTCDMLETCLNFARLTGYYDNTEDSKHMTAIESDFKAWATSCSLREASLRRISLTTFMQTVSMRLRRLKKQGESDSSRSLEMAMLVEQLEGELSNALGEVRRLEIEGSHIPFAEFATRTKILEMRLVRR